MKSYFANNLKSLLVAIFGIGLISMGFTAVEVAPAFDVSLPAESGESESVEYGDFEFSENEQIAALLASPAFVNTEFCLYTTIPKNLDQKLVVIKSLYQIVEKCTTFKKDVGVFIKALAKYSTIQAEVSTKRHIAIACAFTHLFNVIQKNDEYLQFFIAGDEQAKEKFNQWMQDDELLRKILSQESRIAFIDLLQQVHPAIVKWLPGVSARISVEQQLKEKLAPAEKVSGEVSASQEFLASVSKIEKAQTIVEQSAEPQLPIDHPENFLPVELMNTTGFPDSEVYVFIKAAQESDGKDCVLKLPKGSSKMVCELVTGQTDLASCNYRLSDIPRINGRIILYVPKTISGRVYLSVGRPMELQIDQRTTRICDPDGFKPRDPNYYTIYDKVEYSYTNAGTWVNPTAVDFVCIPIHIEQDGAVSEVKAAGFTRPRDVIFADIQRTLEGSSSKEWQKLALRFRGTILRIMAPGKAMVETMPGANPFSTRYLNGEGSLFNYTDFVWSYYKLNTIGIDASELKAIFAIGDRSPDNYIFFGSVNANNEFVFKNKAGTFTETIAKPRTSIPFFAGAQESFDAPNNTPRAIIVRELTSAFEVGLLPSPSGIILSKEYFISNRSKFYKLNPLLPSEATAGGPWYDLYSEGLHKAAAGMPVYTFAYDDALAQDGTLHDDKGKKPSLVKITLGHLSGMTLPEPEKDDNLYQVKFIIPDSLHVIHEGKTLKTNDELQNIKVPISLNINGKVVDLYLDPMIVKPASQNSEGIVVERQGKNVTIIFPSSY